MSDIEKEYRWLPCPVCGKKTRIKIYADTAMFFFPLYCHNCKTETRVDVFQFKMVQSK